MEPLWFAHGAKYICINVLCSTLVNFDTQIPTADQQQTVRSISLHE